MPLRIASLLASSTEILYALGLGDQVVAISHECDHPPEVATKPRVTRATLDAAASSGAIDEQVRAALAQGLPLYEVDAERLAALAPHLIVTQAQCDVCAVRYEQVVELVAAHQALRQTQVLALNPTTLEAIFDDILRLGQATAEMRGAERYVAGLRERVERIRTVARDVAARPRVACIEWIDPLMIAGNWMPELVETAGGRNELTAGGEHSPYVPWEKFVAWNPEVVVVMPCGFELERSAAEARVLADLPGWRGLAAVYSGRVYAVDGNAYFNRSGPRMVDSLEILAHLIHPERFGIPACLGERRPWQRLV